MTPVPGPDVNAAGSPVVKAKPFTIGRFLVVGEVATDDVRPWPASCGKRSMRHAFRSFRNVFASRRQDENLRSSRFSLDIHGARGLFAFLVFCHHVWNSGLPAFKQPAIYNDLMYSLQFGVELFFAISGFVIIGTVKRARSPSHFIFDRLSRIFPVLWVAVLTVVAMSLLSGREAPATFEPINLVVATIGNLLALPTLYPVPLFLPPAWTLSFEVAFYVLAFLYLFAKDRVKINLLLPLIFLGLAVCWFHPRAFFFLCGMIVASGFLDHRRISWLARSPVLMGVIFLCSWHAVMIYSLPQDTTVMTWIFHLPLVYAIVAFISATFLIQGLSKGYGLIGYFLRSRPMFWLGTVSYSFYMWHPIVLAVVKATMHKIGLVAMSGVWAQAAFFVIALPPSLLIAHLSQKILEVRTTEYLRSLWKTKVVSSVAA